MKKLLEKLFTEIPKILCAIIISFIVILPIFIGCAVLIAYTGVLLNYFNIVSKDLLYFIVPKASMLLSAIISAYIGVSISESVYNK